MPAAAILGPLAAHLLLVACLYAWLTVERFRAVQRGEAQVSTFRTSDGEPARPRLVSNCLKNQFELPVLFWVLAMTLYTLGGATPAEVVLAWIFVATRWAHAAIHVLSPVVPLRGAVFSLGALALAGMWGVFLAGTL